MGGQFFLSPPGYCYANKSVLVLGHVALVTTMSSIRPGCVWQRVSVRLMNESSDE